MFKESLKRNGIRALNRYSRTRWFRFLSPVNLTLWRAIERAAAEYATGDLLDAGAGRRPYEAMLRRYVSGYLSVDRTDQSGGGIDHRADLHTLSLGREFDTILCSQVLEHCRDPETVLRRLGEHLAPQGHLIITAPHLSMLHNEPDDYFRFTEHGFRMLLDRAALEPVEIRRIGGLGVFLGHLISTLAIDVGFAVPPLGQLLVYANAPIVAAFVLVDSFLGVSSLFPVNHLVVARRRKQ